VRAAQDLQQAGLDRLRLEKYLEAVRDTSVTDSEQLKNRATLLARSLNIRVDQQCFDKPTAQQVPCLTQNTDQLVLDDAHSQTMVATLTTGAPTDLLAQLSSTPTARSGYYSPYIGAIVDVARILATTHTAQYQYIPALGLAKENQLNLRLNNPPSFRNPKSVLVAALPPVRLAPAPPLRNLDASQVFCAGQPSLVLPADGAPLVFASDLARNFTLHVETKGGTGVDLPALPDPARGGFVIDTQAIQAAKLEGEVSGVLRGTWGFRTFDGPSFRMRMSRPGQWVVASKDASALIVGREDTLHLQSADVCCVSEVLIKSADGKASRVEWKTSKPDEIEVKVPLQNATAGPLTVEVKKFGLLNPDEIPLHSYAEAGRLDAFSIHGGDSEGLLKGTRLDQVTGLAVSGVTFNPGTLSRANQQDELKLAAADPSAPTKFKPGEPITVHVMLKDGRALDLNASVEEPRPKLSMLSKSVQLDDSGPEPAIRLGNPDELPQDARLNFFLKTQAPEVFPPAEKVEVSTNDESFHVLLSVKDGNLTMQDAKTIFAVLDPMKLLGPSAFGPLKFRPVSGDGVEGDWMPLVNLVRVPTLKGVRCAPVTAKTSAPEKVAASQKVAAPEKDCTLIGDKLFLINAVSADSDFSSAVTVPDGFVNEELPIPSPKGKMLFIKLRDDPATVSTAVVPMINEQP
jgi:hypothetical protein